MENMGRDNRKKQQKESSFLFLLLTLAKRLVLNNCKKLTLDNNQILLRVLSAFLIRYPTTSWPS